MAAMQGNAEAENRLGVMYHYGRGVPEDRAEAEKWYGRAAAKGHRLAEYNLSCLRHENGK